MAGGGPGLRSQREAMRLAEGTGGQQQRTILPARSLAADPGCASCVDAQASKAISCAAQAAGTAASAPKVSGDGLKSTACCTRHP